METTKQLVGDTYADVTVDGYVLPSPSEIFGEPVYSYSRAQAIADGVLVDASTGELAEVSRQHFKYPIAMTAEVYGLIEQAVLNPIHENDWRGVWHDILWMSRKCADRSTDTTRWFRVKITGAGRKSIHALKMVCGPGDDGEPVLTVMLPEQD